MAQDGKIITFNLDDLKIREITADTSGSLTFGSWIDILGVQDFEISPEFISKDLPGDGVVIDTYSKLKKLNGSFSGQMVFSAMAVMLGSTSATSGSSPNEAATLTLSSTDIPKYFELDGQSLYRGGSDTSGGDFHITVHKVKLTNFKYTMANEEYAKFTCDWSAVARVNDGKFATFKENETLITNAEGSDSTPPTVSSSVPADAATGVSASAGGTFTVTFSEDIVVDVANYTLVRVNSTTNQTPVALTVSSYNSGTYTVTLAHAAALTGSENYALYVSGVRDKAGNMLATPVAINFVTA